jgi:hypothetical protein
MDDEIRLQDADDGELVVVLGGRYEGCVVVVGRCKKSITGPLRFVEFLDGGAAALFTDTSVRRFRR